MNFTKLTKKNKNISTALMQMAMMASSFSASAASAAYYSGRRGGYNSGKTKSYLVDAGLSAVSRDLFSYQKSAKRQVDEKLVTDIDLKKSSGISELLIVDQNIKDYQQFSKLIKPGVKLVEIPLGEDGLTYLIQTLARYKDLKAIHLFSHANAGEIVLGKTLVNSAVLKSHPEFSAVLNQSVRPGGDFLLYGCELGKGRSGDEFLEIIKSNTQLDVAASNNLTGNAAVEGDWDLEIVKGDIEAKPLANSVTMKDFTEALQVTFKFDNSTDITDAGNYAGGPSSNVVVNEFGSGSNYSLTIDGETAAVGVLNGQGSNYVVLGGGYVAESKVTLSLAGGKSFNPKEVSLKAYFGSVNFSISTDKPGTPITQNITSGSTQTINLDALPDNATKLYIQASSNFFANLNSVVFNSISTPSTNTAPTATNLTQSKSATEGGSAVALDDIVVTDVDAGETITATLTLSNAAAGSFSTGTFGSATSAYNADTGVWTVTGSVADVNAALAAVAFTPSANNDQNFTIATRIRDAANTGPADGAISFAVTAVNDAPVLDSSLSLSLSTNEDSAAPVNGVASGTLVSTLIGGITDPDNNAVKGIAIIGSNTSNGSWWFTKDDGSSWSALGNPSPSAARLLEADANTRIQFQPNANYNGTISSALIIRAWDRSAGSNGGQANISVVGTGGTTPFSTVSTTVSLTVSAASDAPTATNLTQSKSATEGGSAVALDDIVVTDVDAGETITATLTLSNAATGSFSTGTYGSATSTFNAGTGVWTVTGSVADVNAALAAVAFTPSANNDQNFTITTRIRDAANTGPADGTISFTVTGVNDAPTATNLTQSKSATEGGSAVALDDIVVSDVDAGETVTATLTLSNTAAGSLSTGTYGSATSSYKAGTGVWTVTGSVADVNAALAAVAFTPSANNDQNFTITTRIRDAANTGPADGTISFTVTGVNDAPTATNLTQSKSATEGGSAVALDDIVVSDVDAGETVTATLTLSSTAAGSLSTGTYGSSTSTYNAGTGVWTATGSVADVNAALAAVAFTPSANNDQNFTITTRIRDAANTGPADGTISFTVTAVNDTPTDIALSASSINENVAANSTVGNLSSSDVDASDTFTYTLVSGTGDDDNASFNISSNSLRITSSPDYESKSSYSIRLRTTDQGNLSYEEVFTITINNLNETPTDISLSATSVNENVAANATVGALSTIDPDAGNTFTYTLVSGTGDTDNANFNISGSNLRITNSPNYESKNSYTIRVRTTDQGSLNYEEAFTITINDVNEAPTDIALSASSINENVAGGSTVGTLSSTDADASNTFTYSLVAGTGDTDNASFTISDGDLKITSSPNYETKNSYSIRIRTTDQNSLTYEESFAISISNLNETPTDITLSASSINENVAANSTVGTLASTDPDASNTFTYTLVTGTGDDDNASFNISGSSLRITNSPNYEAKNSYTVRVRTTDQGSLTYEKAFTITINNLNEAPTDIALSASSINENVVANSTVGTLSSTDADASNTFTYTLVAGTGDTDNASFNISGSNLRITNSPDYESKNSYTVRIRSTDQGSLTYEEAFTITINDLDDTAPTVTSVNVPSNATYVASQNLDFTVNFNENITVDASGGTLYLSLTIGSSTKSATYQSGSGTSALSFRYTVQAGDIDANGIVISTLALNGGTLKDAAANNAVLTLNSVSSTAGVLIDAIVPTVSSVSVPANGTYKTDADLDFTVNFSENVTVNTSVGTPYLEVTLNTGGTVNAGYVSGSGTSALTFRYTVVSGNLDADGISLASSVTANGGTIKDAASNAATLTLNSVGSTSAVLVDAVAPTLTAVSIASNNTTSTLAKTGDQIIVTFTASEAIGSPSATIAGQTATIANTSGNTYTAKYTMTSSSTEGAIGFSISFSDAAGNSGTAVTATTDASSVMFDKTAPAIPAGLAATNGNTENTISWTANTEGDLKSYKIYGGTSANPTTVLNTANAVATSYTHTGLTNGTTYYYRISAVDNAGNESTVSADATAVPKAPQTITFNALTAKTYGDADFDAAASASSGLTLSYSSSNTAVATIVSGKIHIVGAGTTTITASQTGSAAYLAATDETQTLTVNKKDITVSLNASPAITKVYDNTASAALAAANYTLSGIESGDVNNVTVTGTAAYTDKNVGTGITVTANAFVLAGTRKDNYNLTTTSTSTTGTINKKDITVTLNASPVITKVYDKTNSAILASGNYSLAGLETGDDVTITGTATYADKNVANSIAITANTFVLNGAQKENYNLTTTSATTTGNITKKDITVSLNATPLITKVYDKTTSATLASGNYSLTGIEAGDDVTVSGIAAYSDSNVGTAKTISLNSFVLAGAQKDNYNLTTASATTTGVITKKDITVALNAAPIITKVYDGGSSATLAPANYSLTGIETGDVLSVSGTASYDNSTVATGKAITVNGFVLTGVEKDNYNLTTTSASTTGTITQKVLTVTAENKTKFQNTINPALTVSYSGFITGEDKSVLTVDPIAITTANTTSAIGTYPITVSGGVSTNYSFNYVNGTLTIVPGEPTSISLASQPVYENQAAGILAGTLSSTSDDPSATFTYSLVSGTGSTDNGLFTISGNEIRTTTSLNFEQKASYAVRVRSTTQHNLSLDKELLITISDVNEQPTIADIADQTICYTTANQTINLSGISAGQDVGQTTILSVSSTNNALFKSLNVSQASNGNAQLSYAVASSATGSAVVTVLVQDNGGTANGGSDMIAKSFTITVNPLPVISISSNIGTTLSKGQTAELTAASTGTYQWRSAFGIISGQNSATLTVRPEETSTYTVTVTNANGCSTEQSITIVVNADYEVVKGTNIISPNGDGINDKFIIKNIDMYPKNEVKIFDRAGRLLYSQQNYTDQWDGTLNGSPLAEDTYYYVVDFGPGIPAKKGFITIVKD